MFSEKGMMRFSIAITIWGFIMCLPFAAIVLNWLWWTATNMSFISDEMTTGTRIMSALTQAMAGGVCLYAGPKSYDSARKRLVREVAGKFQ